MKKIICILFVIFLSGAEFSGLLNREVLAAIPEKPVISVTIKGVNVVINIQKLSTADGYVLYYKKVSELSSNWAPCELDLGNQTSPEIELWEGAGLYFTVRAYNSFGKSDYSNIEFVYIGDLEIYSDGEILTHTNEHHFFCQFNNTDDSPTNVTGYFTVTMTSKIIKHFDIITTTEDVWNDDGTYTKKETVEDNSTYSKQILSTDFSNFTLDGMQFPNGDAILAKNGGAIDFAGKDMMLNIVTHKTISDENDSYTLANKISQIDGDNGWNGIGPGSATYYEFDSSGNTTKMIKNFIVVSSAGVLSFGYPNTRTSTFQYIRPADYEDKEGTPKGTPLQLNSLLMEPQYLGIGFVDEDVFWTKNGEKQSNCPLWLK